MTPMTDIPGRDQQPPPGPPQGGQGGDLGFLSAEEAAEQPAAAQDPQEVLKGRLELFRSSDQLIDNLAQQSPTGGKYAAMIKDLLKKWMIDEVASTRDTQQNPRLFGG